MTETTDTETNEDSNSERVEAAEEIGRSEDKVTSAAQEAVESVTTEVEAAVTAAEDAAETVAETVIEAAETAAEKAEIPELAGQVAQIVIDRLREAGLSVSQVTEEATNAAQDVAEAATEVTETAVDIVDDVSDSIIPDSGHFWYAWPPRFPRRRNR